MASACGTGSRDARRRRIVERGTDRLALITGRIQTLPSPPSSSAPETPSSPLSLAGPDQPHIADGTHSLYGTFNYLRFSESDCVHFPLCYICLLCTRIFCNDIEYGGSCSSQALSLFTSPSIFECYSV